MRAFNALYRHVAGRARSGALTPYGPFFYPLDAVTGWNRAYGPGGLRQHQSALPHATAQDAVAQMLVAARKAGQASFLTVLKLFGDAPSPGMMSFPTPGATLTLDFAYRGARTDALLDDLDRIAIDAGGRVNPYKDARMSPATFEASFPMWRDFARHIDPAFTSNFWRRVTG
jgi:FAD/FMN-containing dehydrogenase